MWSFLEGLRVSFTKGGRSASYRVYVMKRVILVSMAASCLAAALFLFFSFYLFFEEKKRRRRVRPETLQRCGRLISWLNIMGRSLSLFHSDWSTRSTLRSTAAGHCSFFSGSLVSRERSKSHFPLSQTVHFFLGRAFWAGASDILVLKV